jgi:predicted permease
MRAALRDVEASLAAAPGIKSVSFNNGSLPLAGDDEQLFWLDGEPKPTSQSEMKWAVYYIVGPGYLPAMQLRLLRGRFFTEQDNEHSPLVAVIDDELARAYFPKGDALGKRLNTESGRGPLEIVGIVGHVKQWGLASDESHSLHAQLYVPFMQLNDGALKSSAGAGVVVRTDGDPHAAKELIRRTIQEKNSELAVFRQTTMDDIVSRSLAEQRFSMTLFGIFGALALLLASIGIYGVVSYAVGQRTREIGLRMALGAQRVQILQLVLSGGGRLALLGVGCGVAAALGLSRLMAGMLYQVRVTDPLTYLLVAALLMLVALLACYLPARRATRVDPMVALRDE